MSSYSVNSPNQSNFDCHIPTWPADNIDVQVVLSHEHASAFHSIRTCNTTPSWLALTSSSFLKDIIISLARPATRSGSIATN